MTAIDPEILAALSDPTTYGRGDVQIEVIHTHASVVFLVGARVYKVKKPVDFGFLDYSTLPRREAMCRAEVELNRRLARDIYLAVVPITHTGGRVALGGGGPILEWAVMMRRLPDATSWTHMLAHGELEREHVQAVARLLAGFHLGARRSPAIASWGSFARVAEACRANFVVLGRVLTDAGMLVSRLQEATECELAAQRGLVETRARAGVPCEIHGDLRLEHVYDLRGDGTPEQLRIVDCVEFSSALRHGDPASDIAFLAMDLRMHGAWALAAELLEVWSNECRDPMAMELLPLFASYRSAVRAKVRALQHEAAEIDDAARARALELARGHLVLAWGELAPPEHRPCLVLVAGLPGTGKSRLAEDLERYAGTTWIRADVVRKELAELAPHASGRAGIEDGLYTPAWNDRTYDACLARAERILAAGGRVVVDASFKEERRRVAFLALAQRMGARARILCCRAPAEAVRERLAVRRDDPSDADWTIYEHAMRTWDAFGVDTAAHVAFVDTDGPHEGALARALACLRGDGLLDADRRRARASVAR